MTPSKIFLYFLLSFIGGIFICSFFKVPQLIIYELFILGAFYSILFFLPPHQKVGGGGRRKAIIIFGICLIILASGILRTEIAKLHEAGPREVSYYTYYEAESSKIPIIQEKLSAFKQKLREVVYQNLSPPQSSILAAIVLGDKQKISSEWKEKLNIAGVRHITAISGMHIVILSGILIWLAIVLGLYRGQAFWFAAILLWLFILMTGAQPSAIRAGIMGLTFLVCQKIGRQKAALNTLILAAAIMLIVNPLLLRHSVGFQLSFLATLGIIYLMPFFQSLFRRIKLFKTFNLSNLLGMTFSAQVFTLPMLIFNFGYLSLVSPITNVLIVPLLPYLMVSGFVFLLGGIIWQPLGWILSFPVWLLLTYLTSIVSFFSQIPWASLTFQISWLWLPVCYLILFLLVWRLTQKEKLKFLKY